MTEQRGEFPESWRARRPVEKGSGESGQGKVDRGASGYLSYRAVSRFSSLDGLRAFSVVAVIWHHVAGFSDIPVLNQGFRGVDLFFAISGFLITTLLLRERDRSGTISLRGFYKRRVLRIFPVYYGVLGAYCLLVWATLDKTAKGAEFWQNLPAFLTYTSNWFVDDRGTGTTFYFAWSLATEEQFYLFWPPLLVLSWWLTKRVWPAVTIAAALVICQVLAAQLNVPGLGWTVLENLEPAILLSAVAAIVIHDERGFSRVYRVLGHIAAAPGMLALTFALVLTEQATILIHVSMVLLVVSVCIQEDTLLHKVLAIRVLSVVGGISYGMYLMHMLCANVVRLALGHEVGVDIFVGTVVLVTGVAYVSFRYFESPILKIAHKGH